MPRGWNRAPDGWWQRSLRGPRPPSEVWPRVQQYRQLGPPQPTQRGKGADKVHNLEVALAALGAEDVAAKTEVETALERAREEKKAAQSNQQGRGSFDSAPEHARCKVKRFEEALKAMGDYAGSRGRFLAGRFEESSTGSPGAPIGQPDVREKVHRAFRASFGRSIRNAQQRQLISKRHAVV